MPVWAAVVIGLASGLGAGVLSTLLTISYQREAEFRSRQSRAAEDFLRAAENVRRRMRHPQPATTDALTALQVVWDDLVSPVTLIELLYGHDSVVAGLARHAGSELLDAIGALRSFLDGDETSGTSVQGHMTEATEAINEFAKAANRLSHGRQGRGRELLRDEAVRA